MKLTKEANIVIAMAVCATSVFGQGPTNRDRQDRQPAPKQEVQRIDTKTPERTLKPVERSSAPTRQIQAPVARTESREVARPPEARQAENSFGRQAPENRPLQNRAQDNRPQESRPQQGRTEKFTTNDRRETAERTTTSWTRSTHQDYYQQDASSHRLLVRGVAIRQSNEWGGHWRDDRRDDFRGNFHFGLYVYSPFETASFVSPWYFYTGVPAYIPASCVTVQIGTTCNWNAGIYYSYNSFDGGLNNAVQDIENVFNTHNGAGMDGNVPTYANIAIFDNGQYEYTMSGGSFRDMMADTVSNVDTISFRVTSITRSGSSATVHAQHVVQNADGSESTINQTYQLQRENGGYVLTAFMTNEA